MLFTLIVNYWLLTGQPNDDRPSCPPPITAERARQNVPSASSYMSLKQSRSHRSSGSIEQQPTSPSTHSVNSSQRLHEDKPRTQARNVLYSFLEKILNCLRYRNSQWTKVAHFYIVEPRVENFMD